MYSASVLKFISLEPEVWQVWTRKTTKRVSEANFFIAPGGRVTPTGKNSKL